MRNKLRSVQDSGWWITGVVIVVLLVFWSMRHESARIDRNRVYVVGTDNTLPYHALLAARPGEPARPTGIAAELMARAAERAGIRLRWSITAPRALIEHRVDLWPANTTTSRSPLFSVTRPFMRHSLALLSREPLQPDQVARRDYAKVLLRVRIVTDSLQALFPRSEIIGYGDRRRVLMGLCRGEAPVALLETRPLQAMLLDRPPDCKGVPLFVTGTQTDPERLGFGSTPEAAPVANLLRSEMDRMIESGEAADLFRKWSYYSNADADLLFSEVSEMRARQISNGLVILLFALLGVLSWVTYHSILARREAMAANQAKTNFLANMSHEMRTPLNGILGLAEVLSQSELEPVQQEYLDKLRSSGSSLLQIVNDVLDLSRVARGKIELRPEPTDLRTVFADLAGVFAESARARQLEFQVNGIDALPEVMVDALRLRQLFHNLVGNAIKFTDCGFVHVTLRMETGPRLRMVVEDSGIGIEVDARERLFEKFYQADTSIHRRFGGTGLGLSIVREIVLAMGGDITVESHPGQGSRFQVSLPVEILLVALPAPLSVPEHSVAVHSILVVEDNAVNQLVVVSLLRKEGHHVDVAAHGGEALDCLASRPYDIVFMDCHMPVLDGLAATRQIRQRESQTGRHTCIIALTASAMEQERDRCLEAGFDDFLSKPVQASELQRVVREWAPKPAL